MSIASLVLGIVWLAGLGSLLAVILGFISKKRIANSNGQQGGAGLSIAGIILGFVGIAGAIPVWIVLAIAGHAVNQFSNSYTDGRNYGIAHYSSNGDVNTVCNNAAVPAGEDSAEFNLGCLAGWTTAGGNTGNTGSGNTGNTG